MKFRLKKRYLGISAVLIALIIFMLFTGDGQKNLQRAARALITIDTTELETYNYDVELSYIGTLYPENEFAVHSKVSGRIVAMNYDIGDVIENGAIIAQIDDTQYQLEYQQAEGKLAMERSKVQQKQMSIDLAEREFERMTALREERVISESQLEKAQYDFERQRVTFDQDQASLANQETAVEMAKLRLSYTNIEAKWSEEEDQGKRVLAQRFVDVGEIINTNRPIASIMEIGLLKAEIFVGEKEYPKFKIGMNVTIEVDAFPGETWEGKVVRVAPFLNQQTRQAKVLISVKNEDLRLRPGMFARTNVIFDHREGVVMLPKECIMEWRNSDGVYLYDDEKKEVFFQRVQVGDVHKDNIEILNAKAITMPVVSVGQHMVRHGMKVNHVKDVRKEEPAKRPVVRKPDAQPKKADVEKKANASPDNKKLSPEERAKRQAAREKGETVAKKPAKKASADKANEADQPDEALMADQPDDAQKAGEPEASKDLGNADAGDASGAAGTDGQEPADNDTDSGTDKGTEG